MKRKYIRIIYNLFSREICNQIRLLKLKNFHRSLANFNVDCPTIIMKAIQINKFGPPNVLQIENVDVPTVDSTKVSSLKFVYNILV